MWLNENVPIRKRDLTLTKPYVNASGTLGFAPDLQSMPFLEHLGAFITNPISRRPRQLAKNRVCLPFQGGFLLHTGWPNPGIRRAIQHHKRSWAKAPLPVIVNLLAESPESVAEMVRELEGLDNILGVELGLLPSCDSETLRNFMDAATGELPVLVNLAPWNLPNLLETLKTIQPAAVHVGPTRGSLLDAEGHLVSGRLYGPPFFPLTLSATRTAVESGLPVIAGCGVFHPWQAQALLDFGTIAVSLHAALWGSAPSGLFIR